MKTDEELAQKSIGGEDAAYQELMRRNMRQAFNLARLYIKTDEDAEDVVQESFFKAWKHLKRFDPKKRFSPWLLTIVRHTALDFIKKKKAVSFSALDANGAHDDEGDGPAFADSLSDAEPLADALFEQAETAAEVAQALDIIHPDHRTVLTLHYHDEMTFEEIADVMQKPMNTVKSWHRRALVKLKGHLHQKRAQLRR